MKIIYTIILSFLFWQFSFAGDNPVRLDLKTGTNFCYSRLSPTYGITIGLKLYKPLSLESGYEWNTYKEKDFSTMIHIVKTVNAHALPLRLKCNWKQLSALSGAEMNFMESALLELTTRNGDETTYTGRDIKNEFRNTYFSFVAGIEYEINEFVKLSASYNRSISPRFSDPDFEKVLNVWKFSVGFRIY